MSQPHSTSQVSSEYRGMRRSWGKRTASATTNRPSDTVRSLSTGRVIVAGRGQRLVVNIRIYYYWDACRIGGRRQIGGHGSEWHALPQCLAAILSHDKRCA